MREKQYSKKLMAEIFSRIDENKMNINVKES